MLARDIAACWIVPLAFVLSAPLFAQDDPARRQPPSDAPTVSAPTGVESSPVVDVTEVATAAQTASATLQRIEKELSGAHEETLWVTSRLETWRDTIPTAAAEVRGVLESTGSITNVEELRNAWLEDQDEVSTLEADLLRHVLSLRADLSSLQEIELLWKRSLDSFQDPTPEAARIRAQGIRDRAATLVKEALQRRDEAIVVQDSLGKIKSASDAESSDAKVDRTGSES